MDPTLEKELDAFRGMFRTDGWALLMQECEDGVENANNVDSISNEQDLFYRKGQLFVLNYLLTLEGQLEAAAREAEGESI